MNRIIFLIIFFLNLFCYSSFSLSNEIDSKHLKWNIEYESLNSKKKLIFCYPVIERVKDFYFYSYLFETKNETSPDKIEEIKIKYISEYIISSFRQHVIIENLVKELNEMSNKGDWTPELRQNYIKNDTLMSLSEKYIGKEYIKIMSSKIPYNCFRIYDEFFGVNSASKFTQKELDVIQDISIEEFEQRETNLKNKLKN